MSGCFGYVCTITISLNYFLFLGLWWIKRKVIKGIWKTLPLFCQEFVRTRSTVFPRLSKNWENLHLPCAQRGLYQTTQQHEYCAYLTPNVASLPGWFARRRLLMRSLAECAVSTTAPPTCTAEWGTLHSNHFHHLLPYWAYPQQSGLYNGRDEVKRFDLVTACSQVSQRLKALWQ